MLKQTYQPMDAENLSAPFISLTKVYTSFGLPRGPLRVVQALNLESKIISVKTRPVQSSYFQINPRQRYHPRRAQNTNQPQVNRQFKYLPFTSLESI